MAEPDNTRQLTVQQENAIDLILQGQSDGEVAEAVGISRQTVCDWRNHNALFAAEVNRRRQEIWGGQTERLRRLVAEAVNVLEEDLLADDPKLRQAAAIHVLRAVGLYGQNLKPTGDTDAEGVEAAWREQRFLAELRM